MAERRYFDSKVFNVVKVALLTRLDGFMLSTRPGSEEVTFRVRDQQTALSFTNLTNLTCIFFVFEHRSEI